MFYVYILQSLERDEFYKGLTSNVNRRLAEHLAGKVKSSKRLLPLKLVHVEVCQTRKEARNLEKFFKSGYGREVIKEIVQLT